MAIRFGTDGWRGVIAQDFTFDNVRAVAQAVAGLIRDESGPSAPVPVGYDVRFLSGRFAETVAAVLEGNGVPTMLPDGPVTTPMVSCQVVASAAPLGICITASHNPPQYNGLKVKAAFGGSAPPEQTARIEALIGRRTPRQGRAPERRHPFLPAYVPRLNSVVDLEAIRAAPLRVVVDSMHGAGGRILEGLLRGGRIRVMTLHGEQDVLIGGEESGGIGVKRYLPERDGILIGLLLLEMLATGVRRLSRRIAALQADYGHYAYRRVDLPLSSEQGQRAVLALRSDPPSRLAGLTVRGIDTLDGLKLPFR